MFRVVMVLAVSCVWFMPTLVQAGEKGDLQTLLRQLEKDIAAVRGLEFKFPVVAKIIPRGKDTQPGVQGYYSLKEKALFLYDDIRGSYERGVLIHEMVHALQDQHFGLKKLHQSTFGSDAELALAALIEGDATYTMIELLKKDQPQVAMMLEVPLEKAKNLRHAFLYAQGARYVKALKERGGWAAVNAAYRFPPRSTAAILHPEGVKTISLGPGRVRGQFGLIELLASHPQTAPLAVKSAAGWKGDRQTNHNHGSSWVVAFTEREQAQAFADALIKHHGAATADGKVIIKEADTWAIKEPGGAVRAVLTRGDRVLEIRGTDETAWRALRERLEGPLPLTVYSRDRKQLSFGQFIEQLLEADLICIGETHDSDPHHQVQLLIIKGLFSRDERLGVGMEMFQRPFQKEIDRYFRGEISETYFLKASEYEQRWGHDWGLYRPIVEFARRNGIPLAALNVPRELTSRLSKVGHNGLTREEKEQLGPVDFQVKRHRNHWYEQLAKLHGQAKVSEEQKERSYQVMTAWDEYMAASAARFQQERRLRRMVVLAGSGHIDHGFGIPDRAARRTGGKAVTIRIEIGGDPEKALANPVTDYLVVAAP